MKFLVPFLLLCNVAIAQSGILVDSTKKGVRIDSTKRGVLITSETENDTIPNPPVTGDSIIYSFFVGELTVTPLPSEGKSLITYTGAEDSVFFPFWVGLAEFVALRIHRNPSVYPQSNTTNGNYWPGIITSRYSAVTDFIDGKNVKVDFVFNGGDTSTPQTSTSASGYFFRDMKSWILSEISANDTVYLDANKTYAIKGGLGLTANRDIAIICSTGRAKIKVSMEDAFVVGKYGWYNDNSATNSFSNTFGTNQFFVIPDNQDVDVTVSNVHIIPPTFGISASQYGREVAAPFFYHPLTADWTNVATYSTGTYTLSNSDTQIEKDSLFPSGTYVMSNFANSSAGGQISGSDNSSLLTFFLENSRWYSADAFNGVGDNRRSGHLLKMHGEVSSPTEAIASAAVAQGRHLNKSIKITNQGTYANVDLLDGTVSAYQLTNNIYSVIGEAHTNIIHYNRRRSHFIRVNDGVRDYRLYLNSMASFVNDDIEFTPLMFGSTYPRVIQDGKIVLKDQIPVVGDSIYIDGVINRKVSDTTFDFENVGLMAYETYPFLGTPYVSPQVGGNTTDVDVLPDCDQLEWWNGSSWVTLNVLEKVRGSRVLVRSGRPYQNGYWRVTFDQPVTEANPYFRVKKSLTEFALNSSGVDADIIFYVMGNETGDSDNPTINTYWGYTTNTTNWDFENVVMTGFWRGAGEEKVNQSTQSLSTLYNLQSLARFKNVNYTNESANYKFLTGRGLYYRNLLTGGSLTTLVDNSNFITTGFPADNNPFTILP